MVNKSFDIENYKKNNRNRCYISSQNRRKRL